MEGLREFLERIREGHLVRGHMRAFLHVVIGRQITKTDGDCYLAGRHMAATVRVVTDYALGQGTGP